jgi:hypothetical protein
MADQHAAWFLAVVGGTQAAGLRVNMTDFERGIQAL